MSLGDAGAEFRSLKTDPPTAVVADTELQRLSLSLVFVHSHFSLFDSNEQTCVFNNGPISVNSNKSLYDQTCARRDTTLWKTLADVTVKVSTTQNRNVNILHPVG